MSFEAVLQGQPHDIDLMWPEELSSSEMGVTTPDREASFTAAVRRTPQRDTGSGLVLLPCSV